MKNKEKHSRKSIFTKLSAGLAILGLALLLVLLSGTPAWAEGDEDDRDGNGAPVAEQLADASASEEGAEARDGNGAPVAEQLADASASEEGAEAGDGNGVPVAEQLADAPASEEGEEAGDGEVKVDNGIPVVYLHIDEDQGTIQDMLDSIDHDIFCYGTISIEVPEGFHYSDFADLPCESIEGVGMSIRGRGNSTWKWGSDKKPFKVKLDKKTDIFGLGKNKHWVLLANAYDTTLIRNRITGWLGDQMGFEFTPRGVPVDLVMTGQYFGSVYLGSYYLSENVRVDKNRLEIDELTEDDTEMPEISGGYLLQNGSQEPADSPNVFYTKQKVCWATHTPSFDPEDGYESTSQQTYIQNHIQKIEDALFGEDYAGEDGVSYRELMDMESAAKYWLVNSISLNGDAYSTGSTYIYKKRDVDGTVGKLYWGPLWDFDFAWNNNSITEGFKTNGKWTKAMLYDTEEGGFVQQVKEYWPEMREELLTLTAEGGVIDGYYEETWRSAEQDSLINRPGQDVDYKEEVEKLKTWINERVAWVDENLELLDNLIHKVTMIADGEVFREIFIDDGDRIDIVHVAGEEEYPEKEGYIFLGWLDENGEIVDLSQPVYRDMTLTASYVSEEEATHATDIGFRVTDGIARYYPFAHAYIIPFEVMPTDAQDKVVEWSSSDETFATVDESGIIYFEDPGDEPRQVTITAKLKYGTTREFTFTATNGTLPAPVSIRPEKEEIQMNVGEQSMATIVTDPSPAKINSYSYYSDDENVAKVEPSGVITAVGTGETFVHITITSYLDDEIELETTVKVVVSEVQPDPDPDPDPEPKPVPPDKPDDPAKPDKSDIPETGDENPDTFFLWTAAAAAVCIPLILVQRRRKRRKDI